MSYDVSIGDFDGNMTSNIAPVIYDHIPDYGNGGGLREIHGKTGKEALVVLSDMFNRLQETRHELYVDNVSGEPRFCAKYDSPNGWGSLVGALIWLAQIMSACGRFPRRTVHVSF